VPVNEAPPIEIDLVWDIRGDARPEAPVEILPGTDGPAVPLAMADGPTEARVPLP